MKLFLFRLIHYIPPANLPQGIYLVRINAKTLKLTTEKVIPFKMQNENDKEGKEFSLSSCIIMGIVPITDSRLKIVFESRLKNYY